MAHVKLLQEWTTIQLPASAAALVQDESGWLDLTDYCDVVVWTHVRNSSNVSSLTIETSPTKDDSLFATMASPTATASSTPVITPCIFASASTPLARYVRWKVTPTASAANITFRIWIVGNPTR